MTKHNPRKPKSDADGSDATDLDAVRAFLHGGDVAEDVDDDPEPPPRPRLPRKVQKMIEEAVRTSGFLSGKERPHKYTKRGTKCSRVWQDDWIERVEKTEAELGRPICGARTMAGTPCTLGSNHPSGRCRFHGGFDLTGAPKGNRNAVLHGLYSRRLQVCGTHCPQWESCPCAGDDVLALPLKERPTCPYEQTEYNTVLTDVLAKIELSPDPDPLDKHNAHTLALLHVMMSRAATALRNQQLIETTTATTDTYQMQSSRQDPCLQAYLRIASEYRRFHAILDYPLHPICGPGHVRKPKTQTKDAPATHRRTKPQAAQKPEPGQGLPYIPSLSSIMGHVTRALHDTDL
ncbi:MAG TPA: hypothetical protein HPP77_04870, partial [Candidatus Hydrogenedentes bacterium]|nr:hypothetical protein [Candidatus Hydrogenedentota bacterium]